MGAPRCVECGRIIDGSDVLVMVRFQSSKGESLVTGRVPMHVECAAAMAAELERDGWRMSQG